MEGTHEFINYDYKPDREHNAARKILTKRLEMYC